MRIMVVTRTRGKANLGLPQIWPKLDAMHAPAPRNQTSASPQKVKNVEHDFANVVTRFCNV
jgi:hypothetical protein